MAKRLKRLHPWYDRHLRELRFKPESAFLGRMRQQVDAATDGLDLGDGLEDAAGDAGLVQRSPRSSRLRLRPR